VKALVAAVAVIALSGCTAISNGQAFDSIARVYKIPAIVVECPGVDEGYTGWAIQLTNDHPSGDNEMRYLIPDSMVETAKSYAADGTRLNIGYRGAVWGEDCQQVVSLEPVGKQGDS